MKDIGEICAHRYDKIKRLESEFAEWKQAEQEGRLMVLPCAVGASVYTVEKRFYPCDICKEMGRIRTNT